MRIQLISISQSPPQWVKDACTYYFTRCPKSLTIEEIALPLSKRTASNMQATLKKEADLILKRIPEEAHCVLLDVGGKALDSEAWAMQLAQWFDAAKPVSIVIGGPEGHHPAVHSRAQARISLSKMTFPHTLAKVMLAEQLYRGMTILNRHPYHR